MIKTQTLKTPKFNKTRDKIRKSLYWCDERTIDTDKARREILACHGFLYELAKMLDKFEGIIQ